MKTIINHNNKMIKILIIQMNNQLIDIKINKNKLHKLLKLLIMKNKHKKNQIIKIKITYLNI